MQTGELTHSSERPVHNFPGNQILTFSWSDQEQARTMADHFASSNVSTRKTHRHLVAFYNQRNWGRFIPGRNDKWNRKFPEFPNFQKKGQPREVNRNFRNEFPENVCSIRFWTRISGNFGRMERALYVSLSFQNRDVFRTLGRRFSRPSFRLFCAHLAVLFMRF